MFAQNVFGLEPATVRVREVRIGRAERRARRRAAARENEILGGEGTGEGREGTSIGDEAHSTQVITTVVSVGDSNPQRPGADTGEDFPGGLPGRPESRRSQEGRSPRGATPLPGDDSNHPPSSARLPNPNASPSRAEKLPSGAYTTFQQLSFAPNFPLAVIADEYTIPPTYLNFTGYKKEFEDGLDLDDGAGAVPSAAANGDPASSSAVSPISISSPSTAVAADEARSGSPAPRSPPGLAPVSPRWVYRDPKGVLRGELIAACDCKIQSLTSSLLYRALGSRYYAKLAARRLSTPESAITARI